MQRVQSIGCKRFGIAFCVFALLPTFWWMPQRATAEDAKESGAATTKSETKPAAETAPEKLIIGTWRGGFNRGKFTANADGTYREFPTTLSNSAEPNVPQVQNAHGTWVLEPHELTLSWQTDQALANGFGMAQMVKIEAHRRYKIARLDQSFLRLTAVDDNGNEQMTLFYRRLGDITPLTSLKDKIPAEVLNVAELAHMDSEEALLLAAWTKNSPQLSESLAMLKRGIATAHGKSNSQELFGFSVEEFKASAELQKLIGVQMLSPHELSSQGLLATEEETALKKIAALHNRLMTFANNINGALQQSGSGAGAGNDQPLGSFHAETENLADSTQVVLRTETLTKLQSLLGEFHQWLTSEAFANPAPALPAAGGAISGPVAPQAGPFAPALQGFQFRGRADIDERPVPRVPDPRR
jgi:hypothetical protein